MQQYVLGVDPGSKGCMVLLCKDGDKITYVSHFQLNNYDYVSHNQLTQYLNNNVTKETLCVIEWPMPVVRGSGHGILKQGANFGFVFSSCRVKTKNMFVIQVSTWQRLLCTKGKKHDRVLHDLVDKYVYWQELYPRKKGIDEGFLDAFCLAYLGLLNFDQFKKEALLKTI